MEDHCPKKLCNELGVDVYVINGSDEGDSLIPSEIMRRTSRRPSRFFELLKHKVIIIDEAR